jgi:hypothetical protein
MKCLMSMIILVTSMIFQTGCLSAYNHHRISRNIQETSVMAYGTQQQRNMVMMGIEPKKAVALSMTADNNEMTTKLMFDLNNLNGVKAYFKTYKEAPISSTISLLGDLGTTYALGRLVENGGSWNAKSENRANNDFTGVPQTGGKGTIITIQDSPGATVTVSNPDEAAAASADE